MRAFQKDILRTIKGSLGRFLAIFLIVGLGSGFYAALRMVCPDMRINANNYFNSCNMMDVRVVSSLGLVGADLAEIENLDCVENATLAYETDVNAVLNGKEALMRVHSLTADNSINSVELKEGKLPESAGECVISADCVLSTEKNIGDRIYIKECVSDIDSTLATKEFEIVGKVESPLYVNFASPGNTTLGSGQLDEYIYVTNDSFASDYPYNEVFLTVKGAGSLFTFGSEYENTVNSAIDKIKEIAPARQQARLDELKGSAQEKLDKSKQEYNQKEAEANEQLNSAQSKLDSSKSQLDSSRVQLDKTPVELLSAQEEISKAQSQLESGKTTLNDLKTQLAGVNGSLSLAQQALSLADAQGSEYAVLKQQYETLAAQKAQLEAGIAQTEQAVAEGEKSLSSAQQQYEQAKSQYYSGIDSYYTGLDQYNSGLSSFQESKTQTQQQLADAKKKLDDAQEEINKLETPEWLIMDRSKNESFASYKSDSARVDSIAQLFPLIFFLVAALVALTTMTRMVEEERLNIGTYKSLGYSRFTILRKFLVYAFVASALGAVAGILLLSQILPTVIMDAYTTMYRMPHSLPAPIDLPLAAIAFAAGVGITVFVTFLVAWGSLRQAPANLMRTKVGKAGSKILLERVKFIWNRLSFSGKVTVRNLLLFKKRSAMTIIGIAGCTGLLLTGFGLNDALNDMIDKQYDELVSYNTTITKASEPTTDESNALANLVSNNQYIESSAQVELKQIITNTPNSEDVNASLIAPKDFDTFTNVWNVRNRVTQKNLTTSSDSVLICEKIKNMFNLEVGDEITLCKQDEMGNASSKKITARVSGIFENYLYNYIICSEETYMKLFDSSEPTYNTYFAKLASNVSDKDEFSQLVLGTNAAKSVSYNNELIDTYRNSLSAVNMVVAVLVVCAALLAFIVLYNLNNINICERKREIATLQVLGFTRKEVTMYIYRETIILTILGCIVGILFGLLLEGFVVSSAEGNMLMFGREIHPLSFVLSALITILFSGLVMFIMRFKFDGVNMVESLKANE